MKIRIPRPGDILVLGETFQLPIYCSCVSNGWLVEEIIGDHIPSGYACLHWPDDPQDVAGLGLALNKGQVITPPPAVDLPTAAWGYPEVAVGPPDMSAHDRSRLINNWHRAMRATKEALNTRIVHPPDWRILGQAYLSDKEGKNLDVAITLTFPPGAEFFILTRDCFDSENGVDPVTGDIQKLTGINIFYETHIPAPYVRRQLALDEVDINRMVLKEIRNPDITKYEEVN